MVTAEELYLEELAGSIRSVDAGEIGAIVNNGKLLDGYCSDVADDVWRSVEEGSDAVRAELIMMLANLKDRRFIDGIRSIDEGSSGAVSDACRVYEDMVSNTLAREMRVFLRMMTLRNPHLDLGGSLTDL